MRLSVRRKSSGAPKRTRVTRNSRVHARQRRATESDTVWNGNERACSHDVSGVAAWRGVHTRYRRRSYSVQRWPGVSRRSRRGATHPSLARSAQPTRLPTVVRVSHRTRIRASTIPFPRKGIPRHSPLRCACITDVIVITVRRMRSPVPSAPTPTPARVPVTSRRSSRGRSTSTTRPRTYPLSAAARRAGSTATPDALIAAAEPYRDEPEVIAPVYEAMVAAQPDNARAMVILANAYWLQGRGPQVVGELATKAIAADPANRGAWHSGRSQNQIRAPASALAAGERALPE